MDSDTLGNIGTERDVAILRRGKPCVLRRAGFSGRAGAIPARSTGSLR